MAQDLPRTPRFLTERQRETRELILAAGIALMAREGRHNITFGNLAIALEIGTATLRRHFADLDALLGTILRDHLMALARALGAVPDDVPDRQKARRAAYLAATRTPLGGFTEAHLLLVRDCHLLPDDERIPLEEIRHGLGVLLAGEQAAFAFLLLDAPFLTAAEIETHLAPRTQPEAATAARVEKPIRATPKPIMPTHTPKPPPPWMPKQDEPPGAWVFNAGIRGASRAPPG
jgi:AcrR family transcriptional regulator